MRNLYKETPKPLWRNTKADAKKKEEKIALIGEALFFIGFLAFCMKFTMDFSSIVSRNEMINSMLVGLSIMCSMAKIMTQRYTPVRFALIMSVCAIMGYSSLISINYLFLLSFLLIMAMQDINFIKIIKFGLYAKIINMGIHVLWYTYVYNTNPSAIRFVFRGGASGVPRHSFFMGHANLFSGFLLWACLDFVFLNYDKLKARHIAAIWLINIIFYSFTFTNSGVMVLVIVTALISLDKFAKKISGGLLTFMSKYFYLFFAIFFPLLTVVYLQLSGTLLALWHILDRFFTGRLWLGAYVYYVHGATFLGVPDKAPVNFFWDGRWGDTFTTFDNYYIGNFVSYGYINLILTAAVFLALCGKMENREKIMIIAFSFYGIMEAYVTNLVICSALFIIGKYIYQKHKR